MRAFKAAREIWDDSIRVLIGVQDHAGKLTGYVTDMTLKSYKQGEYIPEPSMVLSRPEAQELIDALWSTGLRPSNGEGNAGQLGATEKHLEDMRRPVFETNKG